MAAELVHVVVAEDLARVRELGRDRDEEPPVRGGQGLDALSRTGREKGGLPDGLGFTLRSRIGRKEPGFGFPNRLGNTLIKSKARRCAHRGDHLAPRDGRSRGDLRRDDLGLLLRGVEEPRKHLGLVLGRDGPRECVDGRDAEVAATLTVSVTQRQ